MFINFDNSLSFNMYYKPALPDGRPVPLPWQIKVFFFNITWPLRDNAAPWGKVLSYFAVSMGFLIFCSVDEGEILFIVLHFNDINLCVEALVTCIVLNECFLRIFNMAFNKRSFKEFLKKFFQSIYIDEKENNIMWQQIRKGLVPTTVYTYAYILTMISFLIAPFWRLLRQEQSLPYKMILHYSFEDPIVYGFTLVYLCWIGCCIIFFIIGEAFLLASCILHLNARYTILQEEIQHCSSNLISGESNIRALEFRKKIINMFVRNCELNRFAALLNETYDFRIFVMIAFSAALLCVLCFQVASIGASSENIGYVSWMIAKTSELLIFGTLGSTLIQTTDRMTSIYYLSNWEDIIYRSTNSKENVLLMKDLLIIMSLHRNPIQLRAFNFFDASLLTVIKVLRGAFSYFTCLYTVKQTTGN